MTIEDEQSLTFEVHGTILSFSTNNAELMKEIRKDFGTFETRHTLQIDGHMRIIELDSQFPIEVPKYAIREILLPEDVAIFVTSNQRFLEEKGNRIFRVDFEKNNILGYFRSSYDFFYLRFLLKWLVIKTLEKKGVAFIHGSGIIRDEKSMFFVGPPGFGKTHTLLTFLQQGYKLITDDTIFFKDEMVLPLHLRSSIHSDMLEKFPILKKGLNKRSSIRPGEGWLINLGDLFPLHKEEVQPSKLLYMYVWNAEETKIEVVPNKEMLARLFHVYQIELGNSMWFNYQEDKAMRSIFSNYHAFVEKTECYKVYVGNDQSTFLKRLQEI